MGGCVGPHSPPKKRKYFEETSLKLDDLTCSLCLMEYNLLERCPLMICINQHNICKSCVEKFSNVCDPQCPFCRSIIEEKAISKNRILMEILEKKLEKEKNTKVESYEDRVQRILLEARQKNCQKVIYHIQKGGDFLNVRELHLWSLNLNKIIDLSLFTQLTTLDLHKNSIKEIRTLDSLVSLKYLNLSYNEIARIEGLEILQKLQFLDLCHNKIKKIQKLSTLKLLNTLNLNHNEITVIENLYRLQKLSVVYLKFNPINKELSQGSIEALKHRGVILEVS